MHVSDVRTCMDASSAPVARRKILVFEEDKFLASLMHMLLYREGFDLSIITAEVDALDHIQGQSPPELLFINHKWLTDDYPAVIQRMQHHDGWQNVAIILLLNYFDEDIIEHATSMGVSDYLLQPIEPGGLLDLIQKHIRSK